MACTTLSLFIVFTFLIVARFVVAKVEKRHRRRRAPVIRIEPPRRPR
jgi:hypothetical protein